MLCGLIVSHGLDLTHIYIISGLNQLFTVTSDTASGNVSIMRQNIVDFAQDGTNLVQRTALVGSVVGIEDLPIRTYYDGLGGCRTSVDSDKYRSHGLRQVPTGNPVLLMTLYKLKIFIFVFE